MSIEAMKQEIIELAEQSGLTDNGFIVSGDYTEELERFFRLAYARGMLKQAEQGKHWSDCAVHSEPAYPAGECDCGGYVTITKVMTPLTDAQLKQIQDANWVECEGGGYDWNCFAFARAIEAAHGIKEKNNG